MEQNDHARNRTRIRLFYLGLKAKHAAWRRRGTWVFTKTMVKWIWVHSHPKHYHQLSLLDLPLDILLLIFPLLSLLSQACLALTCKPFYCLCGHVLKDNSLAWPRSGRTYEPPLSQPELLRNQFLLRLENESWLYCSGCLKLHPPRRFGLRSDPPERRKCNYHSGVVDLCPCLSLTFFDRIRLEESLREGAFDTSLPLTIRRAFEFSVSSGKRCLMHHCSITYHAHALVDMTMMISLDVQRLEVQKTYRLHLSQPWRARVTPELRSEMRSLRDEMEPILLCPHFDLIDFLYDPYNRGLGPKNCACSSCNAYIAGPESTNNGRYVIVRWRQNLGGPTDTSLWYASSRSEYQTYRLSWYLRHGDIYFDT